MTDRFLPPEKIPSVIWNAQGLLLRLPGSLSATYTRVLETHSLLEKARSLESDSGAVGGLSKEEVEFHFSTRFSGSCGRGILALLDPRSELRASSDRIVSAFAGGKISLLDIPCGTGAGSASLLCAIALLRELDVLPRHPLDVSVVGGDKSAFARAIALEVWSDIAPLLAAQEILLTYEVVDWDVKSPESTTAMISRWVDFGRDARLHFILAANFSGFLGASGNLKHARDQLGEIFRWGEVRAAQVVWIEPQTTSVQSLLENLWAWMKDKAKGLLHLFGFGPEQAVRPYAVSECSMQNPLVGSRRFAVRLCLMMLADRGRKS